MAFAFSAIRSCARGSLKPALLRTSTSRMVVPANLQLLPPKKNEPKLGLRPQSTSVDEIAEINNGLGHRFKYTAEVLVSKIFPAGFGWQYGSCIAANNFGFGADTMSFAVCTGIGDGGFVFMGHTIFYSLKKMIFNSDIKIGNEMQVAGWLGTAAFMAGTSWQPVVNCLVGWGMGFNGVTLLTGVTTGFVFMAGLRFGRHVYSNFTVIPAPSNANLATDIMLSSSIGGGLAAFCGTDVSFGDANWMRPIFGVEETMADLTGCQRAGLSTFIGFGAVQAVENVFVPQGRCWND